MNAAGGPTPPHPEGGRPSSSDGVDGGASSPLDALLFVTLAYLAVACPPQGVVAMGTVMTAAYLVFLEMPTFTSRGAFFAAVMAVFTIVCAMSSANSWAGYDRQVELIRTQEMLASTYALTGRPNRRRFLQRVASAVDDAATGRASVVYLVDLDGFTGVNAAAGHGAGSPSSRRSLMHSAAPSGSPTPWPGWTATSSPSSPTPPPASPPR